jgi:hypothetical protein
MTTCRLSFGYNLFRLSVQFLLDQAVQRPSIPAAMDKFDSVTKRVTIKTHNDKTYKKDKTYNDKIYNNKR